MKVMWSKSLLLRVVVVAFVFWVGDMFLHYIGVGESTFYYISKLGNGIIFAVLWYVGFAYREHWKKIVYSIVFGTWVSLYYLLASYSGLVQSAGIYALESPPLFVVGSLVLHPVAWWVFHSLVFYLGLQVAELVKK